MSNSVRSFVVCVAKLDGLRYRYQAFRRVVYKMDCFLQLALLFVVLPFTVQETVMDGVCQCAAMPVGKSESIIERSFEFNVTCNEEGEEKCIRFCIAMAETAKDKAPNIICEKLNGHMDNLLVRMYANVCFPPNWKYTNKEEKNPICCHEGKSIPCGNPTPSTHD